MAGNSERDPERIAELDRELQEKCRLLADLEVIIEDYRREKSKLLEEIMTLKEELWDLKGQKREPDEVSGTSGD